MTADLVAKLTEKEREALRLVNQHLTSKEIAPILGISIDAVDARVKGATRKLGISDRRKAAVFLASIEAGQAYQPLVYQSPDVGLGSKPVMLGEPRPDEAREVQQPFLVEPVEVSSPFGRSTNQEGGTRNKLSRGQRLALIAAIALGTVAAVGLLVSTLNGLVQLALSRG